MKVNPQMHLLYWLRQPSNPEDTQKDLVLRISVNGRKELGMGIKINPGHWDQEAQQLTTTDEASLRINRRIQESSLKLQKIYDLLETEHEFITAAMVQDKFRGKKKPTKTLMQATDFLLEKMEKKVEKKLLAKGTHTKWKTTKTKFTEFLHFDSQVTDIPLDSIAYAHAEDFYDFLTLEQDLCHNTASKYVKNLKRVVRYAVQRDWMVKNTVDGFVCGYVHPDRDILTAEELMLLYNKHFDNPRLEEIKDCFLFMCFTGYAYKDVKTLEPGHLMKYFDGEDWIIKNREKTWCRENVPLLPIAKEIIEKYRDHPYCKAHNKLLPVKSNQKFNEYLKEVADLAGINKVLRTHMARHTFATTVTLANGVPLETVSALLGHRSLKTTQIYARIVAQKVSEDMKKLKRKWNKLSISVLPMSMKKKMAA